MTNKLIIAAMLALSLTAPGAAYAGEGNAEPFPFNISVSTLPDNQVVISTLPLTNGLPAGALNGTAEYQQAQSLPLVCSAGRSPFCPAAGPVGSYERVVR